MGYIMPVNTLNETGASVGTHLTDQVATDAYTRLTETYMQRAGLRVLTVWDNATAMHRVSYEQNVRNLYGATVQLFSGSSSVVPSIENNRIRFDRLLVAYAGSYNSLRDTLTNRITGWSGSEPLFLSAQVSVWGEMKPNRIVDLCNELNGLHPGKLEFVRADHYFNLFNQANNLPFNLSMSAQTSVTGSTGGGNASSARDGTPYTIWASSAPGTRSLTFNFGGPYNLSRYVIRHAGDSGLSQTLNTRDYRFQVSADGHLWSTIDTCVSNTASVTDVEFPLVTANTSESSTTIPGSTRPPELRMWNFLAGIRSR
jgi:GxGYxYP putative glycoside hydrolase C-terminal domain/F5/8 type C domain